MSSRFTHGRHRGRLASPGDQHLRIRFFTGPAHLPALLRRSEPRRHYGPHRSQSRSILTQMSLALLARRGTAVTDCGRGPPCICTTGLGQRVRAVRRAYGLREKQAPDTTPAPLRRDADSRRARSVQASVRRGWRESSKRSPASVGAGAPFRGIAQAGSAACPTARRRESNHAPGAEPPSTPCFRCRLSASPRPLPSKDERSRRRGRPPARAPVREP